MFCNFREAYVDSIAQDTYLLNAFTLPPPELRQKWRQTWSLSWQNLRSSYNLQRSNIIYIAIFRFGGIVSLEFLKNSWDVLFQQISTTLSTVVTTSLHVVDSVDSCTYCRQCRQFYRLQTVQIAVPTVDSVDSCIHCRQCGQLYLLNTMQKAVSTVDSVNTCTYFRQCGQLYLLQTVQMNVPIVDHAVDTLIFYAFICCIIQIILKIRVQHYFREFNGTLRCISFGRIFTKTTIQLNI